MLRNTGDFEGRPDARELAARWGAGLVWAMSCLADAFRGGKGAAAGATTHASIWRSQLLAAVSARAESLGYPLLAFFEAISAASRGYLRCPRLSPRRIGCIAGVLGALLLAVLLGATWRVALAAHGPRAAAAATHPTDAVLVLYCEECHCQRMLRAAELHGMEKHDGVYRCEKCKALAAYPRLLHCNCAATTRLRGGRP